MDLNARPYRAFVAVADTGSFSRAAVLLNVSQPALSAQIKEMERRLGFALFSRSSRSVALTLEGRLFIDRARRLINETDWANQAAREIQINQLRVGAAHHTAAIAERNSLIDEFMRDEPDIPLKVLRRSPFQLHEDLERGDVDLAILLDFADSPNDKQAHWSGASWTIAVRPISLWVPANHELAEYNLIPSQALNNVAVGTIDRSHGARVAEGVAKVLASANVRFLRLPEMDAESVARQCSMLGHCAINLGWFSSPDNEMRSVQVEGWTAQTQLVVFAKQGDRREGARRFLERLSSQSTK